MLDDHQNNFLKIFSGMARYHNRNRVFSDFIEISAIAIENSILKCPRKEERYLELISDYDKQDQELFSKLFSEVVMGLEEKPCDFLGGVFMGLELGAKDFAQFFTPYEVSLMMATVQATDLDKLLNDKPFLMMSEPASGAGSMIIAFYQIMLEKGYNPQTQMWVQCVDLDATAARMCFIQLSLLGIPCEVIIGNTLTLEVRGRMKSPMHYLGFWDAKINLSNSSRSGSVTDERLECPANNAFVLDGQISLFEGAA